MQDATLIKKQKLLILFNIVNLNICKTHLGIAGTSHTLLAFPIFRNPHSGKINTYKLASFVVDRCSFIRDFLNNVIRRVTRVTDEQGQ